MKSKALLILAVIGWIITATSCDIVSTCEPAVKTTLTSDNFATIQSEVFNKSCATPFCHVSGFTFPNLETGKAYAAIVGIASKENPSLKIVDAGNPDNSMLIRKLKGSGTSLMPLGGSKLSDSVISKVESWIRNGAKND
jgi:hypothetical protein